MERERKKMLIILEICIKKKEYCENEGMNEFVNLIEVCVLSIKRLREGH